MTIHSWSPRALLLGTRSLRCAPTSMCFDPRRYRVALCSSVLGERDAKKRANKHMQDDSGQPLYPWMRSDD